MHLKERGSFRIFRKKEIPGIISSGASALLSKHPCSRISMYLHNKKKNMVTTFLKRINKKVIFLRIKYLQT